MNKVFLIILLFCSFSGMAQKNKIVVKLSASDCLMCSLQLENIKNINVEKYLYLQDKDIDLLKYNLDEKNLSSLGFKIELSDSKFFKFDSSEKSTIYIIDNDENILYKSFLKQINMQSLLSAISSENDNGIINYPRRGSIAQTSDALVILDELKRKLFIIKKDNLSNYHDSLSVFNESIEYNIFQKHFKEKASEEYSFFKKFIAERPALQNKSMFPSIFVQNDTIYITALCHHILKLNDTLGEPRYRMKSITSLLKFSGSSFIDVVPIDDIEKKCIENDNPQCYNISIGMYKFEKYYSIINSNILNSNTSLIGALKIDNEKLRIEKVLKFKIPIENINQKLGYNYIDIIGSNNYCLSRKYKYIYNLTKEETYILPINKSTIDENIKESNFFIYNLKTSKNNLTLVYEQDNQIHYFIGEITNKTIRLISDTIIKDFNIKEYKTAQIDGRGLYTYSIKTKKFVYMHVN